MTERPAGLLRRTRWAVAFVVLTAAVAYLAVGFDWPAALDVLRDADWRRALALGAVLIIANWVLRAMRWGQCVCALGGRLSPGALYLSIALSQGLASVTPGQAGEAAKLWFLKRAGASDIASGGGGLAAERVADLAALLALTAIGVVASPQLGAPGAALGAAALGLVLACIVIVLARRRLRSSGWIAKILDGFLAVAGSPARAAALLTLTALSWVIAALVMQLAITSVGVDAPFLLAAAIMGVATLAGVLSLAPGGAGVAELGIAGLLAAVGVAPEAALAAALMARVLALLGVALSALHGAAWALLRRRSA